MYKKYWTYILSNKSDSTLYIGVTDNLEARVLEHRNGVGSGFTGKYKCHNREKQLKKWRREKKDMLIDSVNKERHDLMPEISPLAALGRNDRQ